MNRRGSPGTVAIEQITLVDLPRFVVLEDGYYTFELGVINVDVYDPRNSIGVWTFSIIVVPS